MKEILQVKLYNVPEAAALLEVSSKTVRKYIKEGRLQGQRIGRGLYIAENNLQLFLSGTSATVNDSKR